MMDNIVTQSNVEGCDLHNEIDYKFFLSQLTDNFLKIKDALFTTNIRIDLFDSVFLQGLPGKVRQHYNCHTCRRFVNNYGSLVRVTDSGLTVPVIWPTDRIPALYQQAVDTCYKVVSKATVNGVFYTDSTVLGRLETKDIIRKKIWNHMAVLVPDHLVVKPDLYAKEVFKTQYQIMVEKREDYKILVESLIEFPIEAVKQAVKLLESDALNNAEKCLGAAKWFLDIKEIWKPGNRNKNNLVWKAVANAPAGWCHVKGNMLGTLLNDIIKGYKFETINNKFSSKTSGIQYQRAQVAPTEGAKIQAEKLVKRIGVVKSFKRRFAKLSEIPLKWKPSLEVKKNIVEGDLFADVKTRDEENKIKDIEIPYQSITWIKFRDTVLRNADKIEFLANCTRDNYVTLLTACDPDAPPIIQWDHATERNPFSWYVYHGGSSPEHWNINGGVFNKVIGVTELPHMWSGRVYENQNIGIVFIIENARDTNAKELGLFPNILKSEFREIRSVIEAFSNSNSPENIDEATASGILLSKNNHINLRVITGGLMYKFNIDRWD